MTDLAALYRELGEAIDGLDAASRALGPDDAETCTARAYVADVALSLYAASLLAPPLPDIATFARARGRVGKVSRLEP